MSPGAHLTIMRVRPRLSRRGFVNYDIWLVATAVILIVAVVVPPAVRAIAKARATRDLNSDVAGVRIAEDEAFDRDHRYTDQPSVRLSPGDSLVSLKADSGGWGVVVAAGAHRRVTLSCGAYDGGQTFRPHPSVVQKRRVYCWP